MSALRAVEEMIRRVEKLATTEVRVTSPGKYPTNQQTPVADVARYQNDGTSRGVTPSRFIERAQAAASWWIDELTSAVNLYIAEGLQTEMTRVAGAMARDVSAMCDRIKTGRLKQSFTGEVSNERRD